MPESYIDDITIVPEVEPLFALAHRQDPQKRPVSIASAQMAGGPDTDVSARLSDVICLNWYYGWYEGGPNLKEPAQPSLFCRKGQERRGVPE